MGLPSGYVEFLRAARHEDRPTRVLQLCDLLLATKYKSGIRMLGWVADFKDVLMSWGSTIYIHLSTNDWGVKLPAFGG